MARNRALCISCGRFKKFTGDPCAYCGFCPSSVQDLAKSFILTEAFDAGEAVRGKPRAELELISSAYLAGHPFAFEPEQVAEYSLQVAAVRAVRPSTVIWWLVRFFGPAILLLGGFFLLLHYTRPH